jgi:hypothetical protein
LTNAIREALGWDRSVLLFRSNTGALRVGQDKASGKRGRLVRFGLKKGASDLIGIVKVFVSQEHPFGRYVGRFIALEVKTPGHEPTELQADFLAQVREMGGYAACVHSVDEALAAVERAKGGLSE